MAGVELLCRVSAPRAALPPTAMRLEDRSLGVPRPPATAVPALCNPPSVLHQHLPASEPAVTH